MNIGFDAKRLFLNHSGLGNYARNLADALALHYPQYSYSLFTPRTNLQYEVFTRPPFKVIEPAGWLHKQFPSLWRSGGLMPQLQQQNLQVYHGLSNELPFNIARFKGKKIVTIHDLIFMRYPAYYKYFDRKTYARKVKSACREADLIISISGQTKTDLQEFMQVPADKIQVHGQSCQPVFWEHKTQADHSVFATHKLPAGYILYVGTIEPRKNLLNLLKAMQGVDMPLVVVGRLTRPYGTQVEQYVAQNNMGSRVYMLQGISNAQLAALYSRAHCFVYPSSFEGFGLPVLEAMVCNTPVITGNNSSLTEVGGPAARYIDVDNIAMLNQALLEVCGNTDLHGEMVKKGFAQANRFTPYEWARKTVEAYHA